MPPLRGTVMGDALGGDDGGVSTLQPGGFATWAPNRELDSDRPEMRGWVPKRGLPATAQTRSVNAGGGVSRQTMTSAAEDAARSERFFTRQKGERDSARKNARQPGQRRSSTQVATHLAPRPLTDPRHDASVRSPSVPPSALSLPPPRRHRTAPAPSLRRPRATVTPPPRRHRAATAPPLPHRATAAPGPRTQAAMSAELQRQRKGRVKTKGYMTEAERAFQPMGQRRPSAEELANPCATQGSNPRLADPGQNPRRATSLCMPHRA